MSWNSDEARQIGRIETKLDTFANAHDDLTKRVSTTESFMHKTKGVLAVFTVVAGLATAYFLSGCATAYTQCDYDATSTKLTESVGWSNVLGKGTIDNMVTPCKNLLHESEGTGLDEGTLRAIEALSKIAPSAAAASALEDVRGALTNRLDSFDGQSEDELFESILNNLTDTNP